MALFKSKDATDDLKDLLEKERALILKGDLSGVIRLAQEKERLLTRVLSAQQDEQVLNRIRAMTERNNTLLANAAKGIKRVTERLRTMDDASQQPLTTYGRDGASRPVVTKKRDLTKRA